MLCADVPFFGKWLSKPFLSFHYDSADNYLFEGRTEVLQSVSLYNDKNSLEQRLFDPRKRPVY